MYNILGVIQTKCPLAHIQTKNFVRSTKFIQQKFGWPIKVFRLNMDKWKFLLIQQNIFLGEEWTKIWEPFQFYMFNIEYLHTY